MAFIEEPTSEQLDRYIDRNYDQTNASSIKSLLDGVSPSFCGRRPWLQAAILIRWESIADASIAALEEDVELVNIDWREFHRTFQPPAFWENRFR